MTALPIVTRELRVVARRPSTYWVRVVIAVMACFMGGYIMFAATRFNMGILGKQIIYSMVSSFIGIFALFSGIRNTADHISAEKREGTLGLLFLTDLKGYDVVLGKLCATAVHSLYGMLAAFPVIGVALIGGGITGKDFLYGTLALLNVVFFAHAVGLAVSSFVINSRRALGSALFIGFLFLWGIPTATSILSFKGWNNTAAFLSLLSPLTALHLALTTISLSPVSVALGGSLARFGNNSFWISLLVSHGLGWSCLGIAFWQVPRSWQNIGANIGWRQRFEHLAHGSLERRTHFRQKLVSTNPFFWLVSRTRFDRLITMLLLIGISGGLAWLFLKVRVPLMPLSAMIMIALHAVLRLSVTSTASRHFAEQRRSGALEFLLACTPLDTKDLVRGQWLALRRQFLAPLIYVLAVDALLITLALVFDRPRASFARDELLSYVLFVSGMVVMLIMDCVALGWTGMWAGISVNKVNRASGTAFARIMAWPCIAAFLIFGAITLFREGNEFIILGLWFFIGIGCDIFWIIYSRKALYRNFRTLAATPYEEQSGIMAAIGRALGSVARSKSTPKPPPIPGT